MGDFTRVQIDFEQSHLIFPALIAIILAVLGLAIVIRDRKLLLASGAFWRETFANLDKMRFLGMLALSVAYFTLMVPVGDIWPNTGRGFLFCSIPFVFIAGLLFMHERTLRSIAPLAVVAILAPLIVWWLFTELFFLTLP